MKVIDPGHVYELAHLDGDGTTRLTFVKREGDGYPGNVGHHEGTNLQEMLRVLIDRVQHLDQQIPDFRNAAVIANLRWSLYLLESRAANRHGRFLSIATIEDIETRPVDPACGHVGCDGLCRTHEGANS